MKGKNYTIFLILLYLWILITNPQNRFAFLGEIHFERIVMFVSWIVLLLGSKANFRLSAMTFLIITFYMVLNISYFFSPYQNYHLSQHWIENYWKYIIFYFLVLFSINNIKDIFYIFVGFVLILFFYQAHSWYDFINGGSYVWQQGIKRIVGVWSQGIGAANYFGMITLYSLPFALFWFKSAEQKKIKMLIIFYFIMSVCSIVYSGTRGAMLGIIFFILINIRNMRYIKIITIMMIISGIILMSLPDYLKHRYFNFMPFVSYKTYEMEENIEAQQKRSARARITGLIDGWELFKKRPLLGYGPGSSPGARKKVNIDIMYDAEESDWQLHSLYGQVLSETGFLGTLLFVTIILLYFIKLRSLKSMTDIDSDLYNYKLAFENSMLLLLFYGLASQTLYRFNWFLIFACHVAFLDIISRNLKDKLNDTGYDRK